MTTSNIFEWIMLAITAIAVIMFSIWVISDFVVSYRNLSSYDKAIKLTYEEFIKNYNLNPDRYTLDVGYLNMVSCQPDDLLPLIYIYFSPMDIIKIYRLKKKLRKSNELGKQKEAYKEYIKIIETDKENSDRKRRD